MSMLQVQVDELRTMAESVGLAMPQAATLMMEAADTIDRLGTENAKLRELVRDAWGDGHPDRSCDGCDIRDECHDDVERMRKDGVLRFSRCLFELRIEERMRELGIEAE